ncbi:hypothetical protein FACS189465_1700 [Clostridia bacterium]|nr:hypothetical protein FACS189465_1700 [Clostridia bacterium]
MAKKFSLKFNKHVITEEIIKIIIILWYLILKIFFWAKKLYVNMNVPQDKTIHLKIFAKNAKNAIISKDSVTT